MKALNAFKIALLLFAALVFSAACSAAPAASTSSSPAAPAATSVPVATSAQVAPPSTPGAPAVAPALVAPALVAGAAKQQANEKLIVFVTCCDGRADAVYQQMAQYGIPPDQLANIRTIKRIAPGIPKDLYARLQVFETEAGKRVGPVVVMTHGKVVVGGCIDCGGRTGLEQILLNPKVAAGHLPPELVPWIPQNVMYADARQQVIQDVNTAWSLTGGNYELLGAVSENMEQYPYIQIYRTPGGVVKMTTDAEWTAGLAKGKLPGLYGMQLGASPELNNYFNRIMLNSGAAGAQARYLKFDQGQSFNRIVINGTGYPLQAIDPVFTGPDPAFEISAAADLAQQGSYGFWNIKPNSDVYLIVPKAPSPMAGELIAALNDPTKSPTFLRLLGDANWKGKITIITTDGATVVSRSIIREAGQALSKLVLASGTTQSVQPVVGPTVIAAAKRQFAPGDRPMPKDLKEGWNLVSDEPALKLEVEIANGSPKNWRWTYKQFPAKANSVAYAFKQELQLVGDNLRAGKVVMNGNTVTVPDLGLTFTERHLSLGWQGAEAEWNQGKFMASRLREWMVNPDPDPRALSILDNGGVVFADLSTDYLAYPQWTGSKQQLAWLDSRAQDLWGAWLDSPAAEGINRTEAGFAGKRALVNKPSKTTPGKPPAIPTPPKVGGDTVVTEELPQYKVAPVEYIVGTPAGGIIRITALTRGWPQMAGTSPVRMMSTADGVTYEVWWPKGLPYTAANLAKAGVPMLPATTLEKVVGSLGKGVGWAFDKLVWAGLAYGVVSEVSNTLWGDVVWARPTDARVLPIANPKDPREAALSQKLVDLGLSGSILYRELVGSDLYSVQDQIRRRYVQNPAGNGCFWIKLQDPTQVNAPVLSSFVSDQGIATSVMVCPTDPAQLKNPNSGPLGITYTNTATGEQKVWSWDNAKNVFVSAGPDCLSLPVSFKYHGETYGAKEKLCWSGTPPRENFRPELLKP